MLRQRYMINISKNLDAVINSLTKTRITFKEERLLKYTLFRYFKIWEEED